MNLCPILIILPFLCFLISATAGGNDPAHFTGGDFSINCGSIGSSPARNGRNWIGDVHPEQLSSVLLVKGSSTASTAINKLTSADPVPHNTVRISNSQFSYELQVNLGQKIIRLHFNPTPYKGFKGFKDLFTVEVGPFTLLSNFSASLTAHALGVKTFVKEFCLNIQENQVFSIVFSPESSQSYDTCAFINGIEIISVSASLSYFRGGDNGLQVVGEKSLVYVDHSSALEMIHRFKIKQNTIPYAGDFDDMLPKWAMGKENKMKNSTWKIPVDVGFRYLIRLHFSKVGLNTGDVMFKILINEMIAYSNINIVKRKDEDSIPWYRDYIMMMRGHKKAGKRDLLISLKSYDELIDEHGVLAGFEIFKLSNPDDSLASPNPLPLPKDSSSHTTQILLAILGHKNAIATAVVAIVSLVNILVHVSRDIWEASMTKEENKPSVRAERLCRRFSFAAIQLATRDFSDALLLGRGGFGNVYKGLIDKGEKTVAIKRLKSNSRQGAHEFLTEIETLSELRHVNLVSLIGYCNEHGEMILVYDYMAGKTLADHLYKRPGESNHCSSLTWEQRINICIGAGRGIDYLHTGHGLIHRDVKASNILLDENFIPKVSDFGLAKPEVRGRLQSHVSTKVNGTYGYFDPYYFSTCKLTRKSDSYAFGVVLLEVLCGRPAVDPGVADDERILSMWARDKISKGEVDKIVAPSLRGEISPDSLKTFVGIAERCLSADPKNRPTMSQVVLQLELALEQHKSKPLLLLNGIANGSEDEIVESVNPGQPSMASMFLQNLTPPPKEQPHDKVVKTELPSGSKARMQKPLRSWPWDAFWNKFKLHKKNEDLSSATRGSIVEAPDPAGTGNGTSPALTGIITVNNTVEFSYEELANATDDFSIAFKIGEGESGTVYFAELRGERAAIKKMKMQESKHEFLAELKVLMHVHHPNLVHLIGYCVDGSLFLVYEYIDNGNLSQHLQCSDREPLPWSTRVQIALDSAKGLEFIHEHTVPIYIHRDIKPTNILIDKNFHVKVADFGLTKQMQVGCGWLKTVLVGTFGYISPEYYQYGEVSPEVDIYAFGVVLYELVSAKEPIVKANGFSADSKTLVTLFEEVLSKLDPSKGLTKLVDPRLGDNYPLDSVLNFAQLARACTDYNPQLRPSMRSIVDALTNLSSTTED